MKMIAMKMTKAQGAQESRDWSTVSHFPSECTFILSSACLKWMKLCWSGEIGFLDSDIEHWQQRNKKL